MNKPITHCKAIAKSTGKPCKRTPVKEGLGRYHLPRELRVEEEPINLDKDQKKNLSLGNASLNQQHTTRDKNHFIRVIVVSTRRKKK